jgi:hypothetical protein
MVECLRQNTKISKVIRFNYDKIYLFPAKAVANSSAYYLYVFGGLEKKPIRE